MGATLGLLGLLMGVALALDGLDAATGGEVYLASVRHLAEAAAVEAQQSTTLMPVAPAATPVAEPVPPPPSPSPPPPPAQGVFPAEGQGEEEQKDFADPREIQQVLREIRDLQREVKQLIGQMRKNPAFAEDLAKMNALAVELTRSNAAIRSAVSSGAPTRDVIQDFRDSQYWDQLNAVRTRVQLPQEIKQIETTLKRLERTIKVKSVQSTGINIAGLETKIAEMRNQVAAAKSALAAGDTEEAQEAMRSFHEGGHPGEIEGTIYRVRDIKQMLKRVRDAEVRAEVDKILQPVIDAFNAGEYLDARETLDEYADDLQRMIQRFLAIGVFRWKNRRESFSSIQNLDALIRAKLDEPDQKP